IERDGDGQATAIVAPGGERTGLQVADGRLMAVQDPAGKRTTLGYDAAGRLAVLVDRRGGHHGFTYDEDGRLVADEDPTGKAQTLSRKQAGTSTTITLTSPEGRRTSWETGQRPDGDAYLETTTPSGAKTTSWRGRDGIHH